MGKDRRSLYYQYLPERKQEAIGAHHLALEHAAGVVGRRNSLCARTEGETVPSRHIRHPETQLGADPACCALAPERVEPRMAAIRFVRVEHDFGLARSQGGIARV